jgi:hypothetical protein
MKLKMSHTRQRTVFVWISLVVLVGGVSAMGQPGGFGLTAMKKAEPHSSRTKRRRRKPCAVVVVARGHAGHKKRTTRPCKVTKKTARGAVATAGAGASSPSVLDAQGSPPVSTNTTPATASPGQQPAASTPTSPSGTTTADLLSGWEPLGEPGVGGKVSALAVNPADPGDVLVGGDMLGVGLSEDGGRTWQATSGFASWEINAFTWDPGNPSEVWVGTLSGPYESIDGGHSWSAMRVGLPTGDYPYSAPVQKVLIDSSNPEHLLAFGGNQSQFKAGGTGALHYGLVYESMDGGAQWSTIANIGSNWNIMDVVAGTGDLQTLYAAVLAHGVYKSTDGGQTWAPVDTGLPNNDVNALAADPGDPNTVWAAVGENPSAANGVYGPGGMYETTTGGTSWESDNNGIPQTASSVASDATSMASVLLAGDGTLYTADQGDLDQKRYESTDGGAQWTVAGGSFGKFYPAAPTPLAWASSANGGFVIGGSSDTLMASTDHGATWQDAGSTQTATGGWHGNGFSGLLGTRIAFSPSQPGDMFLTGFDAGNLLRSTDGGASWTRPLVGWDNYGGGYDIQVGGQAGNIVYEVLGQAGAFNGIAVSQDGGQTWNYQTGGALPARYSVGNGQGSVAIASSDGTTAYAVLPNEQVYVTTNTGSTWTQVPLASPAFAVASSPGNGNTYVATNAGIYEITSPGATPVLITGSPTGLRRLVIAPGGAVYAAGPIETSQSGLWSNQSGSWTRLSSSQWVNDVAIDPNNSSRIVYVTNDNPYHDTSFATGVWISCNAGQTFTQYNAGLPMLRVLSVAFDPWIPGRLIVGTDGRGYWQTELPGC